jgi:hypothetical protein
MLENLKLAPFSTVPGICPGLHIRNIFKEGELEPKATTEESSVVQTREGDRFVEKLNSTTSTSSDFRV